MPLPEPLIGRVALVTGAGRGIGAAIAEALMSDGADVWLNARAQGSLDERCADLTERYPGTARASYFDVADAAGVKSGFTELHKESRRLDILVNNAGIMRGAAIEMASAELIDTTLATNVRGVLLCSQYGARLMARSGGGAIINLTSIIGRFGIAGQSVYAASKAAVIGITHSLSKELAGRQVRVNAIAPGIIETDLLADLPPQKRAETLASIGLGRIGTVDDVAALARFLASDAAQYITGQVIGVDGGMTI